jgi:hypothetical protein
MLNRSALLALTALTAIGTAALAAGAAAKPLPVVSPAHLQVNPGVIHAINPATPVNPIKINPGTIHALNPIVSGNPIKLQPITPVVSPPPLPPAVAIKKPIDIDCVSFKGCDHDHDHDHDHDWDHDHDHDWDHDHHVIWWRQPHYGVVYDPPTVVSAPVATQAPPPCNCLTKQYLQDGSVLFTDLCTKEQAMATPAELQAQAQGAPLQAH